MFQLLRRVRRGKKQGHGCVFIGGELRGRDTSDSLTFPLFHSFHLISSQGCTAPPYWIFPPKTCVRSCFECDEPRCVFSECGFFCAAGVWWSPTEHWGVSLRGPVGLDAWPLGVHINLNEGTKWQACDLDRPLKLIVTCFPESQQRGYGKGTIGQQLGCFRQLTKRSGAAVTGGR